MNLQVESQRGLPGFTRTLCAPGLGPAATLHFQNLQQLTGVKGRRALNVFIFSVPNRIQEDRDSPEFARLSFVDRLWAYAL